MASEFRGRLSQRAAHLARCCALRGRRLFNATYVEGVDIDDNTIPGRSYVDTSFNYQITPNVALFGKIENLFDRDPPITTSSLISPQAASSVLFDVRGRYFSMGARFRM